METVVDEMYYYQRDYNNHPRLAICVIRDSANRYHRGVAICSNEDTPNKKVGRKLALSRALSAMLSKDSGEPILPGNRVEFYPIIAAWVDDVWVVRYKSAYNVKLTSYESKSLNRDIRPGKLVTIKGNIYDRESNVIGKATLGQKVKCMRLEKDYYDEWVMCWKGHRNIKCVPLSNVSI